MTNPPSQSPTGALPAAPPLPPPPAPGTWRGILRTDDDARGVYSESAGIARLVPRAVAVPADRDDVSVLVQWAAANRVALVPRGSGSSMAGGAVGDGVIVDLSRLREIDDVQPKTHRVWCEAGATRDEVNAEALALGLWLPVDPSSGAFCTVGGMAATNAAGPHTLRYGAMRRWVQALDCVFADGTRAVLRRGEAPPADVPAIRRFLETARDGVLAAERTHPAVHAGVRKESSGYATAEYARTGDLVDLIVGSEGTLALILAVEVILAERPVMTASVLAAFDSLDDAVVAALGAREAGAAACELLDRTFLDFVRERGHLTSIGPGTEAVLLVEVEGGSPAEARDHANEIKTKFARAGSAHIEMALTASAEDALWELRHAASPLLARLDPHLASMQFIEDAAVPAERLADYVRGVRRSLEQHGLTGVIFGHAGDAHVHVNPLVDLRRPDWRAAVEGVLKQVTDLVGSLGGTVAGEHGDGRLRAPLLPRIWPPETLASFAAVKRSFDPDGILNPGVKLPRPGAPAGDSIGAVKYDPALPPLPAAARRALDEITQDRGYQHFRLDLLH
jgi:FAD/FMN-containing dehydrogenase